MEKQYKWWEEPKWFKNTYFFTADGTKIEAETEEEFYSLLQDKDRERAWIRKRDYMYEKRKMIKSIIIDHDLSARADGINPELVREYAGWIKGYGKDWQDIWRGIPIITESGHLWSGFHTIEAAKLVFGEKHIVTFKVNGKDRHDAYQLACGTNSTHGFNRTKAEERKAVLRWLEDERFWDWTNESIARKCSVSVKLVKSISDELSKSSDYNRPTYQRYLNEYRREVYKETDEDKIAEAKRIEEEKQRSLEWRNAPIEQISMFDVEGFSGE